MANNLKKTSDLYGNAVDLLSAIPGMGLDVLDMVGGAITAGKVKTNRLVTNVIRDDKIQSVTADKRAIAAEALSAAQEEEAFWRSVDPTVSYDLKANTLRIMAEITSAMAA